ncbi:protein disulfide isomerase [Crepidotus variabilis]|uniref:protein disulfide-isomerase n=1 Tax=Crepidotus variabilis TaxID=179855 RepID=A0A9P6ERZ8_9AGAR|nr:protein disulfide isomerase [Crepidotus variabilis]
MRFSLSTFFLSALIAGVSASNVVDLTPDNFDQHVGKGKPALVEFFAPWCGHCKNLAPVYEQLADVFAHAKEKIVIAKVDADGVGKPLGQKYGVTGFPTLKWFDADGKDEEYSGGRGLEDFVSFIEGKAGVKSNIPPPPPQAVEVYDVHSWEEKVMQSDKNILVSFTAPWCGHCKNMKPVFEKVANTFLPESNCVIANIDGDDKKNQEIALRYGVRSYPTIKFFPAHSKNVMDMEDYEEGRSEEDFVKFLNKKCGTQRAVGGGLNDAAGRIAQLDDLAYRFFKAPSDARDALHKEAKELAASAGELSKRYLYIMEKVANGSAGYIEKESKRLAKLLEKRNLSPSKLDELKIKANILTAFVEEKVQEVKEKIIRAEAEL